MQTRTPILILNILAWPFRQLPLQVLKHQRLRIKGTIQNMEILALIDSGNSHSFVSQQVAL
jgi:hypothetical protein